MQKNKAKAVEFRAECLKFIAFALTIPFGHLFLSIIQGELENIIFKLTVTLPISIFLLNWSYQIIHHCINTLADIKKEIL